MVVVVVVLLLMPEAIVKNPQEERKAEKIHSSPIWTD
jgi:hypothetical protein